VLAADYREVEGSSPSAPIKEKVMRLKRLKRKRI